MSTRIRIRFDSRWVTRKAPEPPPGKLMQETPQ